MKRGTSVFVLFVFVLLCWRDNTAMAQGNAVISLGGTWAFKIDNNDEGITNHWCNLPLGESITLPGSMMEQKRGFAPTLETQWTGSIYDSSWFFNPALAKFREPDNLCFPFWLTPDKYYVGAAWYQREVEIPSGWQGQKIVLSLERPHWETTVFVDSMDAGMQNSLSAPHVYDLSKWLTAGHHRITIRVDNRVKEVNVGPDSHSITDHTQGNWNGIVGEISLKAMPEISIGKLKVYPDIKKRIAKVVATVVQPDDSVRMVSLSLEATSFNSEKNDHSERTLKKVQLTSKKTVVEAEVRFGETMLLWDEFHPSLYKLTATIESVKGEQTLQATFGMRDFAIDGTVFTVNGRKIFLRGNVDCAAFPLTGYPPTNVEPWLKIFRTAKAFGLNHMRYHSWCPPEAAFEAADQEGFYLQVEGPSWANHGTCIGDSLPIDQYLMDECERIIDQYGNHPSFCMMAYGNEPAGKKQVEYLTQWVSHFKEYDSTKVYTSASIGRSWPLCPASEYIVRSEARGLPWNKQPQSVFDYRDKIAPYNVPYVAHEMGQYCVFPNFNEIEKYTGTYKAKNFEMFREIMKEKGISDEAYDFLMASGKFQALCYKSEIEASLRTPGFAGFQLLGLNDFPGQGSAIVGVLDAFWEKKGYADENDFAEFCAPTVVLARLPKFVFKNSDTLRCQIEVSHFGPKNLKKQQINWSLMDGETELVFGNLFLSEVKTGGLTEAGGISVPLSVVKSASHLTLSLRMDDVLNHWDVWVYPETLPAVDSTQIYITDRFDDKTISVLKNGGKVFLHAAGIVENGKDVVQYFRPVFWNTSWFQMKPPHTTGILCDPKHPALANFPTEFYSNMQWWELLEKQQVMNLDSFPQGFSPIVQPIDTWFLDRKLGLVFEAKVGNGKLMVCSADLRSDLQHRVVARQLYFSLLNYMDSADFEPEMEVSVNAVKDLFEKKDRQSIDLHTKDSPDELKPKIGN